MTDKAQSKRFLDTARKLGADENPAAFEEKLRRIVSVKPKKKPKAAKRKAAT